ncbi:MAG: phosphate ABC transporter substrate-binding protein [Lachnospiraceae bacterium]|nr:phosphate ABC transporter substrate-binding protein [Lachnospiraceae bacterium]
MNKKMIKRLAGGLLAMALVGSTIGCGSSAKNENTTAENPDTQETEVVESENAESETQETTASGSLSLAGSTSMEKLCEAMSESFMEAYPGISVTVEYTGSSAGIESLVSGSVDIGNASRGLKDGETESGAVENIVAIDGIAVITDKDNPATDLTTEQLVSVYTGTVTNWSELGGNDEAIVVIGREAGSGTRGAFEEILEVEDSCSYAQELDSTGAVLAKVASTPGAIGYISLDAVDDSVTSLSLNGVAATEENIVAGEYMLSRPFVMATIGEVSAQNDIVQTWFDYIRSEDGQNVIKSVGLILPE